MTVLKPMIDSVVTKAGRVLFVPEEVHFISKDSSLKICESGDKVVAGQEVVKDVFAHMDGIVEIVADNDIIHEVIVALVNSSISPILLTLKYLKARSLNQAPRYLKVTIEGPPGYQYIRKGRRHNPNIGTSS